MDGSRIVALVIGAAAFLAALIYIGRQVSRLVIKLTVISSLPAEVARLAQVTDTNTRAIQRLTARLDGGQGRRRSGGHV